MIGSSAHPGTSRVSPRIVVQKRVGHHADDLPTLQSQFASAEPIFLRRDFPGGDGGEIPHGIVRTIWTGTSLCLLAQLSDDHIFTRATTLNQSVYLLGDCFEIFLKLTDLAPYLEFHVAPNNVVLQLLYPSHREFKDSLGLSEPDFLRRFALPNSAFVSRTWADEDAGQWTIYASIDLQLLAPALESLQGREVEFQFSRYDYPASQKEPVLSSTSVLRKLDFHLLEDWGRLVMLD